MSISLSISEVRAIEFASNFSYTVGTNDSLWNFSIQVNAEWRAFLKAYDGYMSDPQASFMELRIRLKTLREAIRVLDEALAKSASK